MRPFLIAVQFLTRLPVRFNSDLSEKDIAYSQLYYPLVGLLMGLVLVVLSLLLLEVFVGAPTLLSAAIVLSVWVMISGGLHIDGLADSVDAWAGGLGTREKTLAIMKDPYCGPAGVVSIVLLLLLKFAALYGLFEAFASARAVPRIDLLTTAFLVDELLATPLLLLLLAPMLARAMPPLLFLTTPYVRQNGLGTALSHGLPRTAMVLVLLVVVAVVLWLAVSLSLWAALGMMAMALTGFMVLRGLMKQRIGGATGDTAGALVEITEASTLVCLLLIF